MKSLKLVGFPLKTDHLLQKSNVMPTGQHWCRFIKLFVEKKKKLPNSIYLLLLETVTRLGNFPKFFKTGLLISCLITDRCCHTTTYNIVLLIDKVISEPLIYSLINIKNSDFIKDGSIKCTWLFKTRTCQYDEFITNLLNNSHVITSIKASFWTHCIISPIFLLKSFLGSNLPTGVHERRSRNWLTPPPLRIHLRKGWL